MHYKRLTSIVVMTLCLTACSQEEIPIAEERVPPENVIYAVEAESEEVEEVRASTEEYWEKSKLKDIVLPESFKDKLNFPEEETGPPVTVQPVEETILGDSTEEETETETVIEIETETEAETETAEQFLWDREMYNDLGIHAPSLDEWYRYEHSAIELRNQVYVYMETGTDNAEKQMHFEISDKELYITEVLRDSSEELQILEKACKVAYIDGVPRELLFSENNIYYKITCANIGKDELIELATHIISYL